MRTDRSPIPELGPEQAFRFPPVVRHTLPNGLQVRTVEHHTVPVVSMVVQVDAGAVADPQGREGLAAITADMLDEGTGSLSAIDVSEGFARIGAQLDINVGADVTHLSLTTLQRFADRGAAWLAKLLIRPSLRASDFDRVRQMRLNRLRQLKDLPSAVAEQAFVRLMYGEHPYGHLAIGSIRALGATTLEDVATFHTARFGPSSTTVIVVGPESHEGLLRLVTQCFSDWSDTSSDADGPPPQVASPPTGPSRLTVVSREGAQQSELRIGHLSTQRDSPDYSALLVMNAVLGGEFVSRLNLKLREEKGYTYGARSGFDWRRGIAPFALRTSVQTAATADAISDCLAELEAIRGARPPSEHEMFLAKASLTRGYPREFETAGQVARSVARLALYGLPDTYFEEFVPSVQAVNAADVMRVAERHVDPARAVTLVVGDYQAIAESLESIGIGAPRLLPADA